MYLITTCFDWGPVALQHLLVLGGMLLTLRFYQERQEAALAAAFFLFGLALWDKALALWMLSGLGIAVISTFPRQFFATLTKRRLATAVLAFGLGSLPLLVFNLNNHWDTFRGNFRLDTSGVPAQSETAGPDGAGRRTARLADRAELADPAFPAPAAASCSRHLPRYRHLPDSRAKACAAIPVRPGAADFAAGRPHGAARHPVLPGGDDRRLAADGTERQYRGQRAPHHSALAAAADHHRRLAGGSVATAGACRYSGSGGSAGHRAGFGRARHQRVLCRGGPVWRRPSLAGRDLSAIPLPGRRSQELRLLPGLGYSRSAAAAERRAACCWRPATSRPPNPKSRRKTG